MEFPFIANVTSPGNGGASLLYSSPHLVVPYMVWLSVASVAGTSGNLLIIGTLLSKRRPLRCPCRATGGAPVANMRPTGDIFILNLACSDLIVTSIINPFALAGVSVGADFFTTRPALCQALASICIISCVTSLLSIGCISFNRYIYICRHALYNKVFTSTNSVLMCLLVWVTAALIDLPSLIDVGWSAKTFDTKSQKCLWARTASHSYTLFLVLGGMSTPLIIIVFFYTQIFLHMSHAKRQLMHFAAAAGDQQTCCQGAFVKLFRQARMMLIIFLTFSFCWLPYIVVVAADVRDSFPLWLHLFSSMVAHTHASCNFVIYGVANRKIRQSYSLFLKQKVCCLCCAREDQGTRITTGTMHVSPPQSDMSLQMDVLSPDDTRGRALRFLLTRRQEDMSLQEPLKSGTELSDKEPMDALKDAS